jgi:hypothetical protein
VIDLLALNSELALLEAEAKRLGVPRSMQTDIAALRRGVLPVIEKFRDRSKG